MKAYIVQNPVGIFAFDENGEVIGQILFPRDAKKVAEKIVQDELTTEEKQMVEQLKKKGYTLFISSKKNEVYQSEEENLGERKFRQNFRMFAKQEKFSDSELNVFLTEVGIQLTKMRMKEVVKKDKIIMQAVDAIDEIDKSLNIFVERLREWYGLHFPEMGRLIEKHEKYVRLVAKYGLRYKIEEKDLAELKKTSMGIELSEEDERILKEYATRINELYKLREHIENYVDHVLKEVAPNLRELATPLLAARLIAMSGGMDKLAKKPSSTIQLLGAEKALFRYLHGRGRSPKYGLLFTHVYVQNAPANKRGKIARVLASKLSVASKMDYYGKVDKSQEMKKDLEERIKKIMAE
ncbi:MAG: C/D box methylation guide ribonucleoprotein complex aNOP56 subunit [Candidatus Aenigmarchaeota archaeon]|nr:C/D box methylation guide ribonucleoprotein complex aNOP56 subunit [Candidatus Aenigmarchaeota archaeon]